MYISYGLLPFCYSSEVVIQEGEIKRAVAIGGPRNVYVRAAGKIENL